MKLRRDLSHIVNSHEYHVRNEEIYGLEWFWPLEDEDEGCVNQRRVTLDLEDKIPETMKDKKNKDLLDKVYSSLIFGLVDNVLYEVVK